MDKDVDGVLTDEMHRLRGQLETHHVFSQLADVEALRSFMEVHVFAVWDFMSLVKRLQRDLTCVELPWMPPANPAAARLINDIVLAEESDLDVTGQPASHLDLYLAAMRDVGASTAMFNRFAQCLREGKTLTDALHSASVPAFVGAFVRHTIETAREGSTLEVMASFFYGRENVIPGMFQGLLDRWGIAPGQASGFVYYLQRHIELDGDSHGPAANRLIADELARDPRGLVEARKAARQALIARHALWDGASNLIRAQRKQHFMEETPEASVFA